MTGYDKEMHEGNIKFLLAMVKKGKLDQDTFNSMCRCLIDRKIEWPFFKYYDVLF